MSYLQNVGGAILAAFDNLWNNFVDFLPKLLGAAVVFCIGWFVAIAFSVLATHIVTLFHVDKALDRLNFKKVLENIGVTFAADKLVGWIVKWFFVIVFLIAATDILQWSAVTDFLQDVVLYLPNVLIAVVILLVGLVLGGFVGEIIRKAVAATGFRAGDFLATVAQWAIVIFTLMAALVQLEVAATLIETLFTGLVAMLALAGGLAFGLGGKDEATRILKNLKEDISMKK